MYSCTSAITITTFDAKIHALTCDRGAEGRGCRELPEIGKNERREVDVVSCRGLQEKGGNGRGSGFTSCRKMAEMVGGKELPRHVVSCRELPENGKNERREVAVVSCKKMAEMGGEGRFEGEVLEQPGLNLRLLK